MNRPPGPLTRSSLASEFMRGPLFSPSLSCWSPKRLLEGENRCDLYMSGENFLVGEEFTADGGEESNRHPAPDPPCPSRFPASPGAR